MYFRTSFLGKIQGFSFNWCFPTRNSVFMKLYLYPILSMLIIYILHWEKWLKWNGSSSVCQCLVYPKQYKRGWVHLHCILLHNSSGSGLLFASEDRKITFFFLHDHSLSSECFNFLWKNLKLRDYTVRSVWCLLKQTLRKFKDHAINKKMFGSFLCQQESFHWFQNAASFSWTT